MIQGLITISDTVNCSEAYVQKEAYNAPERFVEQLLRERGLHPARGTSILWSEETMQAVLMLQMGFLL